MRSLVKTAAWFLRSCDRSWELTLFTLKNQGTRDQTPNLKRPYASKRVRCFADQSSQEFIFTGDQPYGDYLLGTLRLGTFRQYTPRYAPLRYTYLCFNFTKYVFLSMPHFLGSAKNICTSICIMYAALGTFYNLKPVFLGGWKGAVTTKQILWMEDIYRAATVQHDL